MKLKSFSFLKPFAVLLAPLLLTSCSFTNVQSDENTIQFGIIKYKYTDEAYSIVGYSNSFDRKMVIESTYDDGVHGEYPITIIEDNAFKQCSAKEFIFVDDCNLVSIKDNAFTKAKHLDTIAIPEGVVSIGENAFFQSSITSISLPNSLLYLGTDAFKETAISFNVSDDINYLGNDQNPYLALISTNNSEKKSFTIHEKTQFIADYAFISASSLESLQIPKNIKSIGSYAFYFVDTFEQLSFENNSLLTTIGDNAFFHCDKLNNIVLPNSLSSLGTSCFAYCGNMTSFTLSNAIKTIPAFCFTANKLSSFAIPESVTTIDSSAFRECTNLSEIVIPENVITMGSFVFGYSPTIVYCEALTKPDGWQSGWDGGCQVIWGHVNHGIIDGFKYASIKDESGNAKCSIIEYVGQLDAVIIPNFINNIKVTEIANEAFLDKSNITSIALPIYLEKIGVAAFKGCGFACIDLPSSLISIGSSAFSMCLNLTSISIPDAITNISQSCFFGCSNLSDVVFPGALINIEAGAFTDCAIASLSFPKNLTSIGLSAFAKNTLLTDLVIPSSVTKLDSSCFAGCFSLDNLKIEDGVQTINDTCFFGCLSLFSVAIPNTVTYIGPRILDTCISLVELTIPFIGLNRTTVANQESYPLGYIFGITVQNTLVKTTQTFNYDGSSNTIDYYFPGHLSVVVVNDDVIPVGAFQNCTTIQAVDINDASNLYEYSFAACSSLKTIISGNSELVIASTAFQNTVNIEMVFLEYSKAEYISNCFDGIAAVSFYSENASTDSGSDPCWHYDAKGVPTLWL